VRRTVVTLLAMTLVVALAPVAAAAPGKLDTFFSGDGKQTAFAGGATGYAVAIDAKGRIVVAGYTVGGKPDIVVARFLPNGKPDADFSGDGRVVTNLGGSDYAFDVAIQDDGRIVVAGERDKTDKNLFALVRYTPKGKLDPEFGGGDGKVFTNFGKRYQGATSLVITPSGKLVAAGFVTNGSSSRWAVARYGPKGILDKTFAKKGKFTLDMSASNESIRDLLFAPGGKLVAVGYAEASLTPRFALARLRPNGGLDPTFGDKGRVYTDVTPGSDIAYGAALQPDGRIVVVGAADNAGRADWGVVRYRQGGKLDTTFGGDGKVITPLTTAYEFASGVTIQSNGKIVVTGRATRPETGNEFGVFRYKPGGALDKAFGNDGKVYTDFTGGDDTGRAIAIQTNGKIVVAGEAQEGAKRRVAVARYLAK
jgi:uncharacterized delta-60 repeat protein